jgi:formylglycine-generating enzyme required for sulfatase activity
MCLLPPKDAGELLGMRELGLVISFCKVLAPVLGMLCAGCEEASKAEGDRTFTNGIGQKMLWIGPRSFRMGDLSGQGDEDELPVREVSLSGYFLGATEVTQRQWQEVMGDNPSNFLGADLPVENVSWKDAMEFCGKLTERERAAGSLAEGSSYRLPTEAQWENACRAGGEDDLSGEPEAVAWYCGNSEWMTQPVARKAPNAWGFYDMHGNVREWCLDFYQKSYTGLATSDPVGPAKATLILPARVIRGGSWVSFAETSLRAAFRTSDHEGSRRNENGFRVALVREN